MRFFFLSFIALSQAPLLYQSAHASVPKLLEPEYCEALIDYGQKNYPVALQKIDRLISTSASIPEFYEMKALIFKEQKQPLATETVYRKLLELKQGQPTEQAPYAFELGTLLFQNKQYEEALYFFKQSAQYKFNQTAAWFYSGMCLFNLNQKAQAFDAFENSISAPSQNDEIKVGANFYIAQIAAQTGYATAAFQGFKETQVIAKSIQKNPSMPPETITGMKQLENAAQEAEKSFNRSVFYGSIGLSTIYDSNVLALPVTVPTLSGSGKDSTKAQLTTSFGFSDSPTKTIQFVGNYRSNAVYHTNTKTKTGEFMPHTLSLFLNYKPLSRISGGLKFTGMYMFQNNPKSDNQRFFYEPFQAQAGITPYTRIDFRHGIIMNLEWNYSESHFFTDKNNVYSSRRSGPTSQFKISVDRDLHHRWFNPSSSFSILSNDTVGTEFNADGWSFSLSDQIYVSKDKFTPSFDFTNTTYSRRESGLRDDFTKTVGLTWSRPVWDKTTFSTDVRYTKNDSNILDTAEFWRFVATTTLTMSF